MAAATNRAYKGRLMLIKVGNGASPVAYSTLMGVRSRTITINNEQVDITDSDSMPHRALLEGAGVRSVDLTVQGVFKDDTGYRRMQEMALDGLHETILIQFPNGDTLEGEFSCSSNELNGEHNAEAAYNVSLNSAAAWNFQRSA